MNKLLIPILMFFSTLSGDEWRHVSTDPMPLETEVIFYDSTWDTMFIGEPEEYFIYCVYFFDCTPIVEWWMPAPKTPLELGLICE